MLVGRQNGLITLGDWQFFIKLNILFLKIILFILAVLGLHCCTGLSLVG